MILDGKCKYCIDEICVNDNSPCVADYCPAPDSSGICLYEERVPNQEREEKMNKYIHCAFVRHSNHPDRTFLFTVPIEKKIKANEKVVCHTKYGEREGQLVSDSFWVTEEALKSISAATGAKLPLKNIIGTLETRTITSKSYFCGITENEDIPVDVPF